MADQSKINRADVAFAKLQRAQDGKKAMSEYEAERAAVSAKTARLKALRLARDAELDVAAQAASANVTAGPKKKKPVKKTAKSSATLSQWLADQGGSGRRS